MSCGGTAWVRSTSVAEGHRLTMAPLTCPTYVSAAPKSVRRVTMATGARLSRVRGFSRLGGGVSEARTDLNGWWNSFVAEPRPEGAVSEARIGQNEKDF